MSFNTKYNPEIKQELEDIRTEAETLLQDLFPQRIKILKELLHSPDFFPKVPLPLIEHQFQELQTSRAKEINGICNHIQDLEKELVPKCPEINPGGESKKGDVNGEVSDDKFQNAVPFPEDPAIVQKLYDVLGPLQKQISKDFCLLSMWLTYMVPEEQDGNNFGVDVLNSVIETLNTHRDKAVTLAYGKEYSHRKERADAVKKALKYPNVADYKKLVRAMDNFQVLDLQCSCYQMYRMYLQTYDLLMKNVEKIVKPRSSNIDNMY